MIDDDVADSQMLMHLSYVTLPCDAIRNVKLKLC